MAFRAILFQKDLLRPWPSSTGGLFEVRISAHPEIWRSHPENLPPCRFQNLTNSMGVMGNFVCEKRSGGVVDRDVRRSFCKKFLGALTRCLRQRLFSASTPDQVSRKNPFDLEKTLRTSFSSLASGKPTIPTLAAVRSGRRPSRSDAKL